MGTKQQLFSLFKTALLPELFLFSIYFLNRKKTLKVILWLCLLLSFNWISTFSFFFIKRRNKQEAINCLYQFSFFFHLLLIHEIEIVRAMSWPSNIRNIHQITETIRSTPLTFKQRLQLLTLYRLEKLENQQVIQVHTTLKIWSIIENVITRPATFPLK